MLYIKTNKLNHVLYKNWYTEKRTFEKNYIFMHKQFFKTEMNFR